MASKAAGVRRLPGTAWSLIALAAGLAAGALRHGSALPAAGVLDTILSTAARLWIAALQVTVVPLVVTQTVAAIAGVRREASVAALAGRALLVFGAMLLSGGLLAFAVARPVVALHGADPAAAAALTTSSPEETASPGKPPSPPRAESWLDDWIPKNIVEAAARGAILPVLIFAVCFGLAAGHLPAVRREPLEGLFRGLADAMMVLVGWVLRALPAGTFAVAYGVAARGAGKALSGSLVFYVLLVCGVLLLETALLYPVTALVARVPARRFARAVAPAQMVAVGTRSSIASLPALISGAETGLGLPALATGFLLPFSVALFKLNRTASSAVKLLFLAHLLGIPLHAGQLAVFLAAEMLVSMTAVGVPGGGGQLRSAAVYLALGMPLEGLVLLEAVDDLPDVFKTLTNVTGDMSVAAILCRPPAAAPEPAP